MKCTSKLWVENFFEISKNFNGIFLSDVQGLLRPKMVDTRFYISSKSFLENLMYAYLDVNDDDGRFLEHCTFIKLEERKYRDGFQKNLLILGDCLAPQVNFKKVYFKQVLRSIKQIFHFYFK